LVIQNAVGGWFEIPELKVKLGPKQLVDLDFFCPRAEQESSRELKRAISRGFVKVLDSSGVSPKVTVHSYGNRSLSDILGDVGRDACRQAVLVDISTPLNPPYNTFAMRDVQSKMSIIDTTSNLGLLREVLKKEQNVTVVEAAREKMNMLTSGDI